MGRFASEGDISVRGEFDQEGGGGFNPRTNPTQMARALAPEECFSDLRSVSAVFPHTTQPLRKPCQILEGPMDCAR
jgi:hypothetical protein